MDKVKGVLNQDGIRAMKNIVGYGLAEIREKNKVKNIVYEKYNDFRSWYNRTVGTEELRKYQQAVTDLQERLFQIQEERRKLGHSLQTIRDRSHEIQETLQKTNRQNNFTKYMELLKEDTENMKIEQSLTKSMNEQERCERDVCTAFTNAIHNAHEKQRAQIENTKYLGILISFTGSFLSFLYSSIRSEDLKKVIKNNMAIELEPIVLRMEEVLNKSESMNNNNQNSYANKVANLSEIVNSANIKEFANQKLTRIQDTLWNDSKQIYNEPKQATEEIYVEKSVGVAEILGASIVVLIVASVLSKLV